MHNPNPLQRFFSKDPASSDVGFHRMVIIILVITLIVDIGLAIANVNREVMIIMGVLLLGALALAVRGILLPARTTLPFFGLIVFAFLMFHSYGIRDTAVLGLLLVVIMAGLLIGELGVLIFGGLGVGVVLTLEIAESNEVIQNLFSSYNSLTDYVVVCITLGLVVLMQWLALRRLNEHIRKAKQNEDAQTRANQELKILQVSLQERVDESTMQLRVAAEVGHIAASILDPEILPGQVAELVQQQFDFHYVGLFLLETGDEKIILKAATAKSNVAPDQTLPAGYVVNSDYTTDIGWCVVNKQIRVIQEGVTQPELPWARSLVALPLQSRGQVLGALVVYSNQIQPFNTTILAALQIIANQAAIALDNASLFHSLEESFETERKAFGQMTRAAWLEILSSQAQMSVMSQAQGTKLSTEPMRPEMILAFQKGEIIFDGEQKTALAIPIKVRDQVIGVVNGHKPTDAGQWTQEEISMLQTLTEQVGLALDSARLYEDSQHRAEREQIIGAISGRIRESLDLDQVLQIAVMEMRQALGLNDIMIRLSTPKLDS